MDDGTRNQVVEILEAASETVLESLRRAMPSVRLKCYHWRNPTIELMAFGTFSSGTEVVSLCVGVDAVGDGYHVVGDICHEDGRVVRDVVDCFADSEGMVVQVVREFCVECARHVEVIANALRGGATTV